MREEEQLFDEKQQLQDVSDRYDRVVSVLGENAVDDAVQQDIQEQKRYFWIEPCQFLMQSFQKFL